MCARVDLRNISTKRFAIGLFTLVLGSILTTQDPAYASETTKNVRAILPTTPTSLIGAAIFLAGLLVLWVADSTPVYFAGKIIKGSIASFGDAMAATLGGATVYFLVFYLVVLSLNTFLGSASIVLGYLLAIMAWLAVYRRAFNTGWLSALGIVIVSWVLLHILDLFFVYTFGASFPNFISF